MPSMTFIEVDPPDATPDPAGANSGGVVLWRRKGKGEGEFKIEFTGGKAPTPRPSYTSVNGVIAAPIRDNAGGGVHYHYDVSNPGGGSSGDPEVVVF